MILPLQSVPFVTVVVPTYNRAKMLGITLESLSAQSYGSENYEILVVDNNSSDDTANVVKSRQAKSPVAITYLLESRQGVHYARNSAFKHSKGDILYYTDDDMIADKDLLTEIVKPFLFDSRVGSVTGRVVPEWEQTPPLWVLHCCNNYLLSLNRRDESLLIVPYDCGVISCHQAMRRDAFAKSGGFNPENTAGEWIGDGETGLNIKLRELGYWFAYTDAAVTRHMIPPQRMTQSYLNKRLANQGNCDSYTAYRRHGYSAAGLIRKVLLHAAAMPPRAAASLIKRALGRGSWHLDRARISYYWSRIRYDIRLVRDERWRTMVLRSDWLSEREMEV